MIKIIAAFSLVLLLTLTGCTNKQGRTPNTSPPNAGNQGISSSHEKIFTLDELKMYNGQNGAPAYIAVNGTVYDVSNSRLWRYGSHQDCEKAIAGKDLTELLKQSPHGSKILSRLPVVGTLKQ